MISEFSTYNNMHKVADELNKLFPYVKIKNNTIFASSLLDKKNNPIVIIDSKLPIKAFMIKFGNDYIQIKTIVNTTEEKGLSTKIMNILFNILKNYRFIIDQDVSGGFWDNLILKYPQYKWEKS